jgi:hypothetical protein
LLSDGDCLSTRDDRRSQGSRRKQSRSLLYHSTVFLGCHSKFDFKELDSSKQIIIGSMGDSSVMSTFSETTENISPIPTENIPGMESPHSRSIRNIIDLIGEFGLDEWEVENPLEIEIPEFTTTDPRTPLTPRNPSHVNIFHTGDDTLVRTTTHPNNRGLGRYPRQNLQRESPPASPVPNVIGMVTPLRLDFSTY